MVYPFLTSPRFILCLLHPHNSEELLVKTLTWDLFYGIPGMDGLRRYHPSYSHTGAVDMKSPSRENVSSGAFVS